MLRGDGPFAGYHWVESPHQCYDLQSLIHRHFARRHLLIACFDSGPIHPGPDELHLGWRATTPGRMVSPPIRDGLDFPSEHYFEWWIFDAVEAALRLPKYDFFVNRTAWTLRTPAEIDAAADPTWEKGIFEWLAPLQETFWNLVVENAPLAYLADGDNLVVASNQIPFLNDVAAHMK